MVFGITCEGGFQKSARIRCVGVWGEHFVVIEREKDTHTHTREKGWRGRKICLWLFVLLCDMSSIF